MARVAKKTSLENEHIFPASQLTPLAIKWKYLTAHKRHKEAMELLEQIVVGSTAMFERLAQFHYYHHTVDLSILVSAAQEKVVKWLLKWEPKKGRLFSWFSRCAKNAFRSELVKVNQYRKRYHVTSDHLDKFYGTEDHEIDKRNIATEFKAALHGMACRWGDPQEIGAIRYLAECIVADGHDKQAAIRSAAYAYCISFDLSKFFYSWVLVALRTEMYEKVYVPFTEQDLFRACFSYDHIVDLCDYMTWDNFKRLLITHQGVRMRFPTLAQMAKMKENYEIFRDIQKSDQDPDAVAKVAKAHKKTTRTAQEIFDNMVDMLNPNRTGEYDLYNDLEAGN